MGLGEAHRTRTPSKNIGCLSFVVISGSIPYYFVYSHLHRLINNLYEFIGDFDTTG